MPDSVVNVAAAFSIIFPVRTVYFAPARALEVSGRMLPGESRSQTSQERVRCGLQGRPPAGIVHPARESAQGTSVFLAAAEPLAQGSKKKPVRAVFGQKGLLWGLLGLESREIEKDNNSITYARPFSRTIPVRTPQSASRTDNFRTACHGGW